MWMVIGLCAILAVGAVMLYWKNRADESTAHKAVSEHRQVKVDALEDAATADRKQEHVEDVDKAKAFRESGNGDVKLAIGFLRDSIRPRANPGSGV